MYLEYDGDGHWNTNYMCGAGTFVTPTVQNTICDSWNNSYKKN